MRVAGIVRDSIVDGIGLRDVIFLQGCGHRCEGCHNLETWDRESGYALSPKEASLILKNSSNDITISGGEPLLQYTELLQLMCYITHYNPKKRFWLYTGFRYEEIPPHMWMKLSQYVDVVVDGRFEIDKKDPNLLFRGSSNQRLVDLKKSIACGKVVDWEEEYVERY